MNSVLIVVLNWNGINDTVNCLASLAKQTYSNFKIVLVDNGSVELNIDSELSRLTEIYGETLHIIRNKTNLGFDGGVNTGIRYGLEKKFDYIALFNNDAVAEPNWLETLVSASKQNDSALTTGLLLHEDGKTIDSTGDWYSTWGLPFPRSRGQDASAAPKAGRVFSVSGGASLYRTDLFRSIGLFDETFFAYYEDVDIGFRALLVGFTAYYEPMAIAYHKQGATSSKIHGFATKQTLKNWPLLYIKNVPTSMLFSIGIRFWICYYLVLFKSLLSSNAFAALQGYLLGIWFFWTHAVPERFKIQSSKKVSDSVVKKLLWPELPPDQTGLRKLFRQDTK